jgi:hypothetical protein
MLTVPSDLELQGFLKRSGDLLEEINSKKIEILQPIFGDLDSHTSFSITQQTPYDTLKIEVSSYGDLNFEAIERALSKAADQLAESCQDAPNIPRIIVLSFASRIYVTKHSQVIVFDDLEFKWEYLWKHIERWLLQHSAISAIVIMSGQVNPQFSVYHNPCPKGIELLDKMFFKDGSSIQFNSHVNIPAISTQKTGSIVEFIENIIEDSLSNSKEALTLEDYLRLRAAEPHRV